MHTAQWCNHRAKGVLLPWPWLPWEEPGYYPTSHANRWKRQHMAWLYTLFRSPWRRGGGRNTRKVSSFKHRNASLGFAFVNWSIPVADFCGTPRRQKLTLSLGWTCLRSRGSPRRRWELENKDDYNQSQMTLSQQASQRMIAALTLGNSTKESPTIKPTTNPPASNSLAGKTSGSSTSVKEPHGITSTDLSLDTNPSHQLKQFSVEQSANTDNDDLDFLDNILDSVSTNRGSEDNVEGKEKKDLDDEEWLDEFLGDWQKIWWYKWNKNWLCKKKVFKIVLNNFGRPIGSKSSFLKPAWNDLWLQNTFVLI